MIDFPGLIVRVVMAEIRTNDDQRFWSTPGFAEYLRDADIADITEYQGHDAKIIDHSLQEWEVDLEPVFLEVCIVS